MPKSSKLWTLGVKRAFMWKKYTKKINLLLMQGSCESDCIYNIYIYTLCVVALLFSNTEEPGRNKLFDLFAKLTDARQVSLLQLSPLWPGGRITIGSWRFPFNKTEASSTLKNPLHIRPTRIPIPKPQHWTRAYSPLSMIIFTIIITIIIHLYA